jgi:hypothetical protein
VLALNEPERQNGNLDQYDDRFRSTECMRDFSLLKAVTRAAVQQLAAAA